MKLTACFGSFTICIKARETKPYGRLRKRSQGNSLKPGFSWTVKANISSTLVIDVREYEPGIYRLHIGKPVSYDDILCGMDRLSELSFIEKDLPSIHGSDLAELSGLALC